MSLESDLVADRLRLKRGLAFWRVVAVLAFVLAVLGVGGLRLHHAAGAHLARLKVDGIITDDADRVAMIDSARKDASVKGLILSIDSPGGSVAGGENLHDAIARFAAGKPVVTVMGGTAASAGYMIAVPSARIFASNATLTGSIGVLLQSPDVSGLLDKVGLGVDELVSGPLKGQPSVVKPLSPEGRVMLQGVVMDLYDQFVGMVASGRHMDAARVRALADGRPYTGHQAIGLGLIDQIGTEQDARDWLAANRHLAGDLPVRPLEPQDKAPWWRRQMRASAGGLLLSALDVLVSSPAAKTFAAQGLVLDGPVALWQP
ncbi:signal peptide peptidase SppA [Lichenicoccus sp.]|uniref:signal peptide peptidase SppA n=1 Tax=Lichenicoccus sp. TaxID=2781899 RepID=UPI003D122F62